MPTAWVTDAQRLEDIGDVQAEMSVLLKTGPVERFLSEERLSSTAVIGPKGFGKTFVLKAKRVLMQDGRIECLPRSAIVDRPGLPAPELAGHKLTLLTSADAWMRLWSLTLSLTALKQISPETVRAASLKVKNRHFQRLLEDHTIASPYQILSYVIALDHRVIRKIFAEIDVIVNAISYSKFTAAIFVDNIDEYVDSALLSEAKPDDVKQRYDLWHNAQIGAWKALRSLQGANAKLRIFLSIRKEAYYFAQSREPQINNLDAFAVKLTYTNNDITQIINNNIGVESRLVDKTAKSPMIRFVGDSAWTVVNIGTGQVESLVEYWLRHCIGRPRDAVAIGAAISELDPPARTPSAVRQAVHRASEAQVEKLFTEAKWHVRGFDPELLHTAIKRNVLTEEDVARGAKEYAKNYLDKQVQAGLPAENGTSHIFCLLYSLGLVGVVQGSEESHGDLRQIFPEFGSVPLGKEGVLPKAKEYLIHPALSDFLIKRNANFVDQLDRFNIIGDERDWHDPDDYMYVAVGDISQYRHRIMQNSSTGPAFTRFWNTTVDRERKSAKLSIFRIEGGDRIILADHSPTKVVRTCQKLAVRLKSSKFNLDVRFGAHAGFWRLDEAFDHTGDVIGVAARIEPHAAVGHLLASEQFQKSFASLGDIETAKKFIGAEHVSDSKSREDGTVNISKSHEEPEYLRLWYYVLTC